MTPGQEAIAEKIIELHKGKNGILDWTVLYYQERNPIFEKHLTDNQKNEQLNFIKAALIELDLIELTNNTGDKSRLKQKGFSFVTFGDERKQKAKKERQEKIKAFPQRYWYLVALVTYFGGWATEIIRDRYLLRQKQDTNQLEPTILITFDTLVNHKKTLSCDSFAKPNHKDTAKKGQ
jgi:hypothetical protein